MERVQYDILKNALDASSMRQQAISGNIANVNTPGYKVNKVAFESLLEKAQGGSGLNKTNEKHFGIQNVSDVKAQVGKNTTTSVQDNGNNVDIDYEMAEMAANSLYYQSLISQLNSKYSMFRTVIK